MNTKIKIFIPLLSLLLLCACSSETADATVPTTTQPTTTATSTTESTTTVSTTTPTTVPQTSTAMTEATTEITIPESTTSVETTQSEEVNITGVDEKSVYDYLNNILNSSDNPYNWDDTGNDYEAYALKCEEYEIEAVQKTAIHFRITADEVDKIFIRQYTKENN